MLMKLKCVTGKPKKALQIKCSSGEREIYRYIYICMSQNLHNLVYRVRNTVCDAHLGLIQFALILINKNLQAQS